MGKAGILKTILLFIVMLMTVAINMQDNFIARLGFDTNYLLVTLVAVVFTGLLAYRNLLLIVLVLFLCVGANMPADFMQNLGIDRDYLTGILVAVVLVPVIGKIFGI